jgi:hypothetical protein
MNAKECDGSGRVLVPYPPPHNRWERVEDCPGFKNCETVSAPPHGDPHTSMRPIVDGSGDARTKPGDGSHCVVADQDAVELRTPYTHAISSGKGIRVLVCGSRRWSEDTHEMVYRKLDHLEFVRGPFSAIVHGCAHGVDRDASSWGREKGLAVYGFEAEWLKYGKKAGPIRNALMLTEGNPDLVIAFPGGNGTADMVGKAKAAGVEVIEVKP